jgi:hypothetical protein
MHDRFANDPCDVCNYHYICLGEPDFCKDKPETGFESKDSKLTLQKAKYLTNFVAIFKDLHICTKKAQRTVA